MKEKQPTEQTSQDHRLIVGYILGELSAEDRQRVEDRYFTDPDFLEQMDAVEDELLNDYVRGALSQGSTAGVERGLLNSTYQRRKVEAARGLLRAIESRSQIEAAPSPAAHTASKSRWRSALDAIRFRSLSPQLVLAVIALCLAAGWFADRMNLRRQLKWERDGQAALRQQLAQKQQEVIAQAEQRAKQAESPSPTLPEQNMAQEGGSRKTPRYAANPYLVTFLLRPPPVRSGENPPQELPIPARTKTLRLELLHRGKVLPTYYAGLKTADGDDVKSGLRLQRTGRSNVVAVEIPADLLRDGNYTLKLYAPAGDNEVGLYNFKIRRQ